MFTVDNWGNAETIETIAPTTATGFASATLAGDFNRPPRVAYITVEDADINFTVDGTAPTAAAGTNVGHHVPAGEELVIYGAQNISAFKCIDRVAAAPAKVKVTLFF